MNHIGKKTSQNDVQEADAYLGPTSETDPYTLFDAQHIVFLEQVDAYLRSMAEEPEGA